MKSISGVHRHHLVHTVNCRWSVCLDIHAAMVEVFATESRGTPQWGADITCRSGSGTRGGLGLCAGLSWCEVLFEELVPLVLGNMTVNSVLCVILFAVHFECSNAQFCQPSPWAKTTRAFLLSLARRRVATDDKAVAALWLCADRLPSRVRPSTYL